MGLHTLQVIMALIKWLGFESQWVAPHKSQWLYCEETSPPKRASSLRTWHLLGQQTKFSTHQIMHTNNHSTHILHPTPGTAYALPIRKDRHPHYTLVFYCTVPYIPASTYLTLQALHQNVLFPPTLFIIPALILEHQFSDAKCQHAVTMDNPTTTTHVG